MTSEMKRVLTAVTALGLAACGTTTPPEATRVYAHDLPKHNVPRSQDTPESFAAPTTTVKRRASRSAPRRSTITPTRGGGCSLDDIRRMESGNKYGAVSRTGKYRGAYQFDQRTWESVGGTGDPAAASPEEQDARAAELMRRRGTQPWSVCR